MTRGGQTAHAAQEGTFPRFAQIAFGDADRIRNAQNLRSCGGKTAVAAQLQRRKNRADVLCLKTPPLRAQSCPSPPVERVFRRRRTHKGRIHTRRAKAPPACKPNVSLACSRTDSRQLSRKPHAFEDAKRRTGCRIGAQCAKAPLTRTERLSTTPYEFTPTGIANRTHSAICT